MLGARPRSNVAPPEPHTPLATRDRQDLLYTVFFTSFYRFSTEELRLATGASAPVARKTKINDLFFIEGIVKGMYTVFIAFQKQSSPPSSENSLFLFR